MEVLLRGNHPSHGTRVVAVGASGRAAIELLHAVGVPASTFIAVARNPGDLADCPPGVLIPLRPDKWAEDFARLKQSLKGAQLVVVAGTAYDGVTRGVLTTARALGAAVARVVGTATEQDPVHGVDHMINEILAEHNAWIAGDLKGRGTAPDVTPQR